MADEKEYTEKPESKNVKAGEKIQADIMEEVPEKQQSEPELMQEYHEPTARNKIIGGIQKSTSDIMTGIKTYREKKKAERQTQEQPQQRRQVVISHQTQRPFYENQHPQANIFGGSSMFGKYGGNQSALARMSSGSEISPLAQMGFGMKQGIRPQAPARQRKAKRSKKVKQKLTTMQKIMMRGNKSSMASFGKMGMFRTQKKNSWF